MNFMFACGGTAGHINPALALAGHLRRTIPGANILFVGAGRELEKRLIPDAGYELINIKMSGLRRSFSPKGILHNIKTAANLITAGIEAKRIIHSFKPLVVIGTGGYICYPVLKKAAKMDIPTIVHESNAVPGLTTKMLSGIVDNLLISFPGLEKNYKKPERVVYTGTPVRGGFGAREDDASGLHGGESKHLVLSFWGSLGAKRMNEMMAQFIKLNIESGKFRHIHAAGMLSGISEMKENLERIGVTGDLPEYIELREYIDDMHSVMSDSDVVMCRAGGSTIAELTAMKKPAVLIPSPYVSNNEQVSNAEQIVKIGGAIMLEEKNCTGKLLFDTVMDILDDGHKLKSMALAQESLCAPDAVEKIVEIILSLADKEKCE